jgi:hypothetical protein
MDPVRFDTLTKSVSAPGTRRALLWLLAALPLGVMLAPFLSVEEVEAKRPVKHVQHRAHRHQQRRQQRRGRHHHESTQHHNPGQHKDNPTHHHKGKQPTNLCQGKADRDCCGASGNWCQAGVCVAATATVAECGGRCDCDDTCSASPIRVSIPICGQPVNCPACDSGCEAAGCLKSDHLDPGPAGPAYYCVGDPVGACTVTCSSADLYCIAAHCHPICLGTG